MAETLTTSYQSALTAILTQTGAQGAGVNTLNQVMGAVALGSGTGLNNANQVYAQQITLAASGTTTLTLSAPGNDALGNATAFVNAKFIGLLMLGNLGCNYVASVVINAAGTGYVVNDVLTTAGGTGTEATLKVTSIGGGGTITGLSILTPGSFTANPTTTGNAVTGGTGTTATVNLTMATVIATTPAAYVETDYLTIGNAGTHPWNGIVQSTGTIRQYSGSNVNPGFLNLGSGGAVGFPIVSGSSDQLKFVNSGSNPVTFLFVIVGATA